MFDNQRAFAPFFDDPVVVEATRDGNVVRSTVRACVFDQGFDDVLSGESTQSVRRRVDIIVRRCDWPNQAPPKVGDMLELHDVRFRAFAVGDNSGREWTLSCKEAK